MAMTHARPTVCGFSFGKNLTKLNYPIEAAVHSVLPLCDEFVFAVGQSEDDTRQRVANISPKITIIDTQWPEIQVDGTVLAVEANKALDAAQATGCRWGIYIQADEVIHEDDLSLMEQAMARHADDPQIKALLFRYLHFVLDYQTTDPWMYHKASRIMKLDQGLRIFGDACGPGMPQYTGNKNDGYLDKNHMGSHVAWAEGKNAQGRTAQARVFHYGWVKTRQQLDTKFEMVEKLWWGSLSQEEKEKRKTNKFGDFIGRYGFLKNYKGSHPKLMSQLIQAHEPYGKNRNRWLNPRFYREILSHGFKG